MLDYSNSIFKWEWALKFLSKEVMSSEKYCRKSNSGLSYELKNRNEKLGGFIGSCCNNFDR